MWETHITCPFFQYICVVFIAMGQKILEKGIEVMTKQEFLDSLRAAPVSYTHLTLPTILLV